MDRSPEPASEGPDRGSGPAGALGLALVTLPGLLPGGRGAGDPLALAAWLALVAAPLGALAGRRPLPAAAVPPLLWLGLLVALPGGRLPAPWAAGLAAAALFALGLAIGGRARPERAAAGLALASLAFAAAPLAGGWLAGRPWPPALAARLLDLSPLTFVLECGGVDWMRHPAVYDAAGTASIGPELRAAWSGPLAAVGALVVGCLLVALARRVPRPGRTAASTRDPE